MEEALLLDHERGELLLFEWHSRGQWSEVPMDVAIALLASQTEDVEALGWNDLRDGATEAMDEALQSKIRRSIKVLDDAFFVGDRSNECIAEERRVTIEEGNVQFILENDGVLRLRYANDATNKAFATRCHFCDVRVEIERDSLLLHVQQSHTSSPHSATMESTCSLSHLQI